MKISKTQWLGIFWMLALATISPAIENAEKYKDLFTTETLAPQGEYYQAEAPDTLDLAEHARLAVRGLTNFLDPERGYMQYQMAFFNITPPFMAHYGMEASNQGKLTESLLLARHMSGSRENLDMEAAMLRAVIDRLTSQGLFYNDLSKGPWAEQIKSEDQLPVNTSRMMMAFMALYRLRPDPRIKELITKMADGIVGLARDDNGAARFSSVNPEQDDSHIGVLGYWQDLFYHGTSTRALARAHAFTGDEKYLHLAGNLKNLLLRPKYWVPECAPKVVVPAEHAQFQGHHHSYCATLMGLLWLSSVTNDVRLQQFVREGYEYLRNFGIARIGLFGEMCTTGDMTWLAIKLSDLGVGDYWEDADQYVRNQLVELQITEPDRLERAVAEMPKFELSKIYEPKHAVRDGYATESLVRRNTGVFLSDASNPTKVRPQTLRWTICCSGNCPPALYAAWESTVRGAGDTAQVNLLLNRVSQWLDMDSYLPYEGKVVIKNKTARTISVRMPRWVNTAVVESAINGRPARPLWLNRYLVFQDLSPRDRITIQFPVKETEETYTLLWKEEDMWPESTNPGNAWKPKDPPQRYTLTLQGNTLVDIEPRSQMPGLPLYQRDEMKATKSPMREFTRYVSPITVNW